MSCETGRNENSYGRRPIYFKKAGKGGRGGEDHFSGRAKTQPPWTRIPNNRVSIPYHAGRDPLGPECESETHERSLQRNPILGTSDSSPAWSGTSCQLSGLFPWSRVHSPTWKPASPENLSLV